MTECKVFERVSLRLERQVINVGKLDFATMNTHISSVHVVGVNVELGICPGVDLPNDAFKRSENKQFRAKISTESQ